MGLKQSIVVVNEFTYKTSSGGTRGGTPGNYVMQYMARSGATEDVTPTRVMDADSSFDKYIKRVEASEKEPTIYGVKRALKNAQKRGGVAFSHDSVSLSDERLKKLSAEIQSDFDNGKTVMKTVLSFDEDWLLEHGILPLGFSLKKSGDYRGHVDQLKLRYGIMAGLKKMSVDFDDLRYIGCIQVDTKHLHVHLSMVDHGRGTIMKDGTQRGKLSPNNLKKLRRGIDEYLDRKKMVRHLSSSVAYDKQHTVCMVRKFVHRNLNKQGFSQFLLACLPSNRNLWRASSHCKEMRKANAIAHDYAQSLFEQHPVDYQDAVRNIEAYAQYRKDKEDLSDMDYEKLVKTGKMRLENDCVNAMYGVLKQIPKKAMDLRTPMLDLMSMDYKDMASCANDDALSEFGFKLRSYSSRLKYHRDEYHRFKKEYQAYENATNKSEDAKSLGQYLRTERDYNFMLMVKYQYFLTFIPTDEDLSEEFQDLQTKQKRLRNLKAMRDDDLLKRLTGKAAETYGIQKYGLLGGDKVKSIPGLIDRRIQAATDVYQFAKKNLTEHLLELGFTFDGEQLIRKKAYPFDVVKALDLHHLGYDFVQDCNVSLNNVNRYLDMTNRRYQDFQKAKSYLIRSGQSAALSLLPVKDVASMKQYADTLSKSSLIQSLRSNNKIFRKAPTVRLGTDYMTKLNTAVKDMVHNVSEESFDDDFTTK